MSVRIALLDSGINDHHPHIRGQGEIVHGLSIDESGEWGNDPESGDLLGHGTCAAAAILDLAPGCTILSVKIFRSEPRCPFPRLLEALDYAIAEGVDWINLSLGTTRPSRCEDLQKMIERASEAAIGIVAPAAIGELACYPGALPGCHGVLADDSLSREQPEQRPHGDGKVWFASGRPRDLPGLPRDANLSGVSLAAANLTGFLAAAG